MARSPSSPAASPATTRSIPLVVSKQMRRMCPPGEWYGRYHAAEKLRDPSHVCAISVKELFALFERAGLRVVHMESYRLDNELEDH